MFGNCQVTSIARTVVDIGRTASREDALVVADAALAAYVMREQLHEVLDLEKRWPGARGAEWIVDHADEYAESALETLGRLAFIEDGLPVPISNAWVQVGDQCFRLDHLLADRWLVLEGDGAQKYDGRLDASRVFKRQQEREWLLREAGLHVFRYDWNVARFNRRLLADRVRWLLARHSVHEQPFPWWRGPVRRLAGS